MIEGRLESVDKQSMSFSVETRADRQLVKTAAVPVLSMMERDLTMRGAEAVCAQLQRLGSPMVVEQHIERWEDERTVNLRAHYRLTAVESRRIVVPVFEFVNHAGQREWKCPACGTINVMDATYCGEMHKHAVGCGRPREQLRLE